MASSEPDADSSAAAEEDLPDSWEEPESEVTDSDTSSQASWQQQAAAAMAQAGSMGPYSDQTLRSLALIDQELLNYDLIEALVAQVRGWPACMPD
jgi:hypothetical protein